MLDPSNAARRMACPGSYKLELASPRVQESEAVKEARIAREYALDVVRNAYPKITTAYAYSVPDMAFINSEMREGAQLLISEIQETLKQRAYTHDIFLNDSMELTAIHPSAAGTLFCYIISHFGQNNFLLTLFDYKYGHTYTDAYENWQMLYFMAQVVEENKYCDSPNTKAIALNFTIKIVQPRCFSPKGNVSTWNVPREKINSYIIKLRASERTATSENAPCVASTECNFCTAKAKCSTLQDSALRAVESQEIITPSPLTPEQLGRELRVLEYAAKKIEARINGLTQEAICTIKRGDAVPFYSLQQAPGREKWTCSVEEVTALGEMYGQNLLKPREVLTPAQARKLKIPEEMIAPCVERQTGTLKLVQDDVQQSKKTFNSSAIDRLPNNE